MSEERVQVGADIDVREMMREIDAQVTRKRELGLYPPDVLSELDITVATTGVADEGYVLKRAFGDLQRSAGFSPDVVTASQKPVIAPVVAKTKQAIRASVRWYMTGVLQQIQAFAGNVSRTTGLLIQRTERLDRRLDEQEQRIADEVASVRRDLEGVALEMRELRAVIDADRVRDRLAQLDRGVRDLRARLESGRPAPALSGEGPAPAPGIAAPAASVGARSWAAESAMNYFEFENRFRGSEEDVAAKQRAFVELFRGAPGPVVDMGCGRGEFLKLLRDEGIEAYGVDRHPDMVAHCTEQGLDVRQGDVLEHLAGLPSGALGGVFAAQMVEHLDPPEVVRFFELAAHAIASGGTLVAETINPQSLFVFAAAFYVDLGHLRPLHPLTLRFLAETAGFAEVDVRYLAPPPPDLRPQPTEPTGDDLIDGVLETINENFRRVDDLLFGPQDYAVVARR